MVKIQLPENVSYIIGRLHDAGYEAYAVGGCVRDCILGNTPADWDITTSAYPEQVKELFNRTIDTGIKHGTVTIMLHGEGYEVTTYRIDGDYHDGRHPDSVSFTASLDEDLKRRDFTINAFVYNNENGIIDLFDGLSDLDNKIIRCVGNPMERFTEDALRILRALRFAARFSFTIDKATLEAAKSLGPRLALVSAERVQCELDKLLLSDNPGFIRLLNELELDKIILPELCRLSDIQGLCSALEKSPKDHYIRWTLLCYYLTAGLDKSAVEADAPHYADKAKQILRRLKFDNKTIDTAALFIKNSLRKLPSPADAHIDTKLRRLMHDIGKDNIESYLSFRASFCNEDENYEHCLIKCIEIIEAKQCTCLKELALNGRDLTAEGYAEGHALGLLLEELLNRVLEEPSLNNHETLLTLAAELSNKK
ncbi:MAG: CCA tRNA nucleotidyltransferase [Lachnospiraceae bacterium]|nr:CCA tRNA nucleotidyltransferase [Lachnospiraceae bacterium]